MRYLMVLGLLALTCSAFADLESTAGVELEIGSFLSVEVTGGNPGTFVLEDEANTDPESVEGAEETFEGVIEVKANVPWGGGVGIDDDVLTSGEGEDAPTIGCAAGSTMPDEAGDLGTTTYDLSITPTRSGLSDPAGTYTGTVRATVAADE